VVRRQTWPKEEMAIGGVGVEEALTWSFLSKEATLPTKFET
jgi:hypothetical protein